MKKWEQLKAEDPTKKRDFQVRVHVIEARDLQPRDSNGMSDPVCIVNCINKKMNTKKYSKTTICTWDHLMFFEYNVIPDEFFTGKLKVGVYDANTILRDELIGAYEFDLATIYEMDKHELYRKWVALTDVTGKKSGIQGYLKLSVVVLGPNDQAPGHDEEEEQDEEQSGTDLQSMILLPPTIKTEEHALELSIYKAEALPKMDTLGKCDGFVLTKFGGNPDIKTEVVKNSYSPVWNERLVLPVTLPTMTDTIKVQVRDWDAVGKDETVATFFMKYSEILKGTVDWRQPRWVNLYGTPEGIEVDPVSKVGKLADKMNEGFIDGSAFRGRLLLSAENRPSAAKLGKNKINPGTEPATANYILRFDLLEAAELDTKAKIAIEVTVGAHRSESKKVSVENGSAAFYEALSDVSLALPRDKTQIPDVFVEVYKHPTSGLGKKKRIGFVRVKVADLDNNAPPRWELIENDIFADPESANLKIVGFLQFKLQLGLESELPKREPVQKPKMKKYQLRAHIYQARDLPAADANGVSDPYAVVRVGKYQLKTKVHNKTLFPLWYESLQIPVEIPENLNQAPDLNIAVWDYDQLDGDDYLGRTSMPLTKVGEQFQAVPTWYPLYRKSKAVVEGEILASFQLIPEEKASQFPVPKITPEYKDCSVEVSVIGLRDLLPYRLLPMTRPYIEVDCGTEVKLKSKICDTPSAKSPNILETLTLNVKLPTSRIFSPPLNIRVYDDRIVYQALVATRSVSLAQFIPWEDPLPVKDIVAPKDSSMVPLDEEKPTVVDVIPGAKGKEEEPPKEEPIKIVPLEEDVDVVDSANEKSVKNKEIKDKVLSVINTAAPSKVAESLLPGFTEVPADEKKADREVVKAELESTFTSSAFTVYKLFRAKAQQGRRIQVEVGTFKGKIRVLEKGKPADPTPDLAKLYEPKDYVVRAYILEGFQFVPKDSDGKNNPYVQFKCGKTKVKDLKEGKQGTNRPQFFKCYEAPVTFPGVANFEVSVWDYDKIGSDDLIGATTVDIENRIFNNQWKDQKKHPIEFRTLWTPSSSNPQGQVRMWVDILTPEEAKSNPIENIAPPVPLQYELRVIVWETKDVVFKDKKMSDIFLVGYPEGTDIKPQTTDTHWRSEDGTGKFNWRMKFPIVAPNPTPRFKIQIWDKDLLNPNDAIAEANLNMRPFYTKAYKNKSDREEIEKQWVDLVHPAAQGVQGRALLSFELLSLEEAKRRPAGYGRKEPNENPHLDEPVRPETSFNPLRLDKYVSKIVWGQNKGKIMLAVVGCCLLILLILILSILHTFFII